MPVSQIAARVPAVLTTNAFAEMGFPEGTTGRLEEIVEFSHDWYAFRRENKRDVAGYFYATGDGRFVTVREHEVRLVGGSRSLDPDRERFLAD